MVAREGIQVPLFRGHEDLATRMRLSAAETLLGQRLEGRRRLLAPAALAMLWHHGAPTAVRRAEVGTGRIEPLTGVLRRGTRRCGCGGRSRRRGHGSRRHRFGARSAGSHSAVSAGEIASRHTEADLLVESHLVRLANHAPIIRPESTIPPQTQKILATTYFPEGLPPEYLRRWRA